MEPRTMGIIIIGAVPIAAMAFGRGAVSQMALVIVQLAGLAMVLFG